MIQLSMEHPMLLTHSCHAHLVYNLSHSDYGLHILFLKSSNIVPIALGLLQSYHSQNFDFQEEYISTRFPFLQQVRRPLLDFLLQLVRRFLVINYLNFLAPGKPPNGKVTCEFFCVFPVEELPAFIGLNPNLQAQDVNRFPQTSPLVQ